VTKPVLFLLAALLATPAVPVVGAKVGGKVSPDGAEVHIDLPDSLQKANIGSPFPNGPGCCVFRSLDHAARWANEPALYGMPEWMANHKPVIPGGGYPSKVAQLVPLIAKERGLPAPPILQVEGPDIEIIKRASANGIMPCVTYGVSASGRYGGSRIAHMVNTSHADDSWLAVLDNNFPGSQRLEWNTPAEFRRAYTISGGGWSVFILKWGPPPPPFN
jgi:hypothetical protein